MPERTVPASEYDALCDLVAALVDRGDRRRDRELAVANCREFYDPAAAELLERVLRGDRSRELFA